MCEKKKLKRTEETTASIYIFFEAKQSEQKNMEANTAKRKNRSETKRKAKYAREKRSEKKNTEE
jgi:hypothetical protein